MILKVIGVILLTTGVIFGGGNAMQRWLHKQRMRRNDQYKKKLKEAYKRKFAEGQREINRWRKEQEQTQPKHLNVVCKNPAMLPAWQ